MIIEIFRCYSNNKYKLFSTVYPNKSEKVLNNIGTIDMIDYDRERAWQICNWPSWSYEKPANLHACIYECSIDIVFHPKNIDIYDISLCVGWKRVNTLSQVLEHYKDLNF